MAKNKARPTHQAVNKENPSRIPTKELGRSGLNQMGGVVYEEWLRQLSSDTLRNKAYREMSENDSTIGAVLFAVDMLMRQVDWNVKPAGEETQDEEDATFLEECLHDMSFSWADTLSEVLTFLVYGWAYCEIVYKYRSGRQKDPTKRSKFNDGKMGWRKIALRGQDSLTGWKFDEDGGVAGMTQSPAPDYAERTIPIERALLFRTNIAKNNPEGKSILRCVYRDWYYKKRIQMYEAIGIERDLAGFPVLYVPEEWTQKDADGNQAQSYTDAKEFVVNIKRDEQEGAVLPAIFDENNNRILELTLLNSQGKRTFDTDKIIQRYDQRIAMSVLADFILLGSKNVGSFALSSDKTELFSAALGAWLDMIAGVFNTHAVPRLFEYNGMEREKLPELCHGDIESPNLAELGEFINKLSGAGIDLSNDVELENYLRRAASLPERAEDEELDDTQDNLIDPITGLPVEPVKELAKKAEREDEFIEAIRELRKAISGTP